MRYSVISAFVALAGVALAQPDTTAPSVSTPTGCAAQNIVAACLDSLKPRYDNCPGGDYKCGCEAARNVLTCFNNCPQDPARHGWNAIVLNCDALFPSTTASVSTSSSQSSGSSATSTPTSTATKTKGANNSTATEQPKDSDGAASVMGPAGGLLAIAMGVAALF